MIMHGAVKRAVNQHQNEPKPTKKQPTNQPKKKAITKQPNKQPTNSPSSKYRNQLLKQNKATNAAGINILLVCHVRIKQSVINTIK